MAADNTSWNMIQRTGTVEPDMIEFFTIMFVDFTCLESFASGLVSGFSTLNLFRTIFIGSFFRVISSCFSQVR